MANSTCDTAKVDPKGLILESYRIEGVTQAECRSIFFDWAMGPEPGAGSVDQIKVLLSLYSEEFPDHPMTEVLREGLGTADRPKRRGGWRSRRS